MKKFKFICSAFTLLMLMASVTYFVYALSSLYVQTPSRNLSFNAGENIFFDAKITYLTSAETSKTLNFGISETSGELVNLNDNTLMESDGDWAMVSLNENINIVFENVLEKYQTTYQITNTGEKAFILSISGIAYDNIENQRYTTTVNETQVTPTLQNENILLKEGTATYTVTVEPNQTSTILITYQLARINQSFSVEENISLNFELKN